MKKDCIIKSFLIVLIAGTMGVGIYNSYSNDDFFEASIAQILTLLISLCLVFWATQYKNDQRKTKEHAEKIIEKLQMFVTKDEFFSFDNNGEKEETKKMITTNNRKISNCVGILKKYSEKLNFQNEVTYIEEQVKEYKGLISEHIEDLDYLSKSESSFRKYSENIDSKCDAIILSLYQ